MQRAKVISLLLIGIFLFGVNQAIGEEQSKLIEGAKREGKLSYWVSGWPASVVKAMEKGFKEKYGLHTFQVIDSPMGSGQALAKLREELKAGRVSVDMISYGTPDFYYQLLRAGEIMKYDSPEYKYFPMVQGVGVEPGYWVMTYANCYSPLVWHPKYIKKALVKHTDVLDPQLKGMICCGDATRSEVAQMAYLALRRILGKDYFVTLAKQDLFWVWRTQDLLNKVGSGERPVALLAAGRTVFTAVTEGFEVKVSYPKEGVVVLALPFILLTKAPNPNAAKLFIDYVHSVEGQKILAEAGYIIGRKDVPISPKVLEYVPRISEMNVIPVDWKSISEKEMEAARKEFVEIFERR